MLSFRSHQRYYLLYPRRPRFTERAHEHIVIPCLESSNQLVGCVFLSSTKQREQQQKQQCSVVWQRQSSVEISEGTRTIGICITARAYFVGVHHAVYIEEIIHISYQVYALPNITMKSNQSCNILDAVHDLRVKRSTWCLPNLSILLTTKKARLSTGGSGVAHRHKKTCADMYNIYSEYIYTIPHTHREKIEIIVTRTLIYHLRYMKQCTYYLEHLHISLLLWGAP